MEELLQEIRDEFHIPPFFPDDALRRKVEESVSYFEILNPGCDYTTDLTYRELLKNRVYYSYSGMLGEFKNNYAEETMTWQMYTEVEEAEEDDE